MKKSTLGAPWSDYCFQSTTPVQWNPPSQFQVCAYATNKTCYMVCRKRNFAWLWGNCAGFRGWVFCTQLTSTESSTAASEMIVTAQALVLVISDFDLNGQVNNNSCRIAHLRCSASSAEWLHLCCHWNSLKTPISVWKSLLPLYTCQKLCREGSRVLVSMTAATVHHAPVNCAHAQLHF